MAKPDGKSPTDHPDDGDPGIILSDYVPEKALGKYDEYILAMLAADEKIRDSDPDGYRGGRRTKATVPSESRITERTKRDGSGTETVDLEVEKTVRLFQESARDRDRTAKLVGRRPEGDGMVLLDFILAPKQKRPRAPKPDSGTGETTTPDTTVEATEA